MAKQIIAMPYASGIVANQSLSYAFKVYNTVTIAVRCKKADGTAFITGDTVLATLPTEYRPTSVLSSTLRFLVAFLLSGTGGSTMVVGPCLAYVTNDGAIIASVPQGVTTAMHILIPEQSFEI